MNGYANQIEALISSSDNHSLVDALEDLELTWPEGTQPTEGFYATLLLAYYINGQLEQAYLAWQRIPEPLKTPGLAAVWKVGQHLRTREYPQAQAALRELHGQLDEGQTELLKRLHSALEAQVWRLIQKAYSSIRVDCAAAMLGRSEEDVRRVALDSGMTEDTTRAVLYVSATSRVAVGGEDRDSSSGAQLATLSDYISHLER